MRKSSRAPATQPTTLSYELPVDLSEKQIESDVANYFGFISGIAGEFGRFRLLDVNEQLTGADKKFVDAAFAYYLQFKKPIGLRPVTSEEASTPLRSDASAKQHVRRFRRSEELEQEPYSVCFPLRAMAEHAVDFQHNILRSYETPPLSRALYICPLELKSTEYVASMGASASHEYPFLFRRFLWIRDGQHVAHVARMIPYLRGHAAIVPHDTVTSADHYYSFSRNATDVAFHSPHRLDGGPSRLSDFLGAEVERIVQREDPVDPVTELAAGLRRIATKWIASASAGEQVPEDDFEWLHWHGRQLHEKFGIRQMIVLRLKGREQTR